MTVFRVLFNHWKEFITHRSKIPEGEDPREHFAEMLRRHRADNKSRKEASERRRLARLSAERKKKEKEEREKKRIEDLSRWELKRKIDNDVSAGFPLWNSRTTKGFRNFFIEGGCGGGWAGGKSKPLTLPLDSSLRTQSCCEHSVKKT